MRSRSYRTHKLRRVLLTLEFMPSHGGVERLLHERARQFQPEALTVIAPWLKGAEAFDAEQPYRIARVRSRLLSVPFARRAVQTLYPIYRFFSLNRKERFELVECGQAFPFTLFAYLQHKLTGIPYMVWIHGNDLLAVKRIPIVCGLLRRALLSASCVIVISNFVANLVREVGVEEARIQLLHPAIDVERFLKGDGSRQLRRRLSLEGKRVILTVGRLVERKGADQVIRSLPELVQKYPDLVYVVVGSGPEEPALKLLARELHVEPHVVFAGSVSHEELPAYFQMASVFTMPSRFIAKKATVEGFGLVFLEAGAAGLPVVAGRAGGVTDVVRDMETGLLVDPESVPEITRALDRILSDEKLAKSLGEKGRSLARHKPQWEKLEIPDVGQNFFKEGRCS